MHKYYTPKTLVFQGVLSIFTIFVNYADFYVNIVMLTDATSLVQFFIILYDISRCRVMNLFSILNVVLARNPAKIIHEVNIIYLQLIFVQLNDEPLFSYLIFDAFLHLRLKLPQLSSHQAPPRQ